ncbi:MAG: hypothetical protein JSV11_00395 [Nitrospiraceae bacterium]|nr:MAG: hypothetical protein JSV11_00395 [Nitrospiraceae bacterium]
MYDEMHQCNICKKEYTSMHVEARPGVPVYVCSVCMEKAKDNFIFICLNCGRSFSRPKASIVTRLQNTNFERASMQFIGVQLIQGIDICITCDPQGIVKYVYGEFATEEEKACV